MERWQGLVLAIMALTVSLGGVVMAGGPGGPASTTDTVKKTPTKSSDDHPDVAVCKGKEIVTLEEKFDDGSKLSEQVVRLENGDAIKQGLTVSYWPNGGKRLEMGYVCGYPDGPKVTYFTDGSRRSVGAFVKGKENGTWIEWYRNGQKSKQFTMNHGAWDGVFTVWYDNGQKRMEVTYVKGQRQGRLITWDKEGNMVHQVDYVDNKPQPTPRS